MISANLCPPFPTCAQIFTQRKTISHYCLFNLWGFFYRIAAPCLSLSVSFYVLRFSYYLGQEGSGVNHYNKGKKTDEGSADFNPSSLCWGSLEMKRRIRQPVERCLQTSSTCHAIIKQLSSSHVYPPLISTRKYNLEENCYYPSEEWARCNWASTHIIKHVQRDF